MLWESVAGDGLGINLKEGDAQTIGISYGMLRLEKQCMWFMEIPCGLRLKIVCMKSGVKFRKSPNLGRLKFEL